MYLEILVEEPSAEKVMHNILPILITGEHDYRVITYQGKADMLKRLPLELKAYARWIPEDYILLILIDRDQQDCKELKDTLEKMVSETGLKSKSFAGEGKQFSVVTRIAIEELEAWFFGDAEAVRAAYPHVSKSFERKAAYRIPDNIKGGTWEALERILQTGGYFKNGLRKIECADEISKHMQPLRNRSKSFQVFWEGLNCCIQQYGKNT